MLGAGMALKQGLAADFAHQNEPQARVAMSNKEDSIAKLALQFSVRLAGLA